MAALALLFLALAGCDLLPKKPDAVFILYRDRMKAEKIESARQLLSDDSRRLAVELTATYQLKQPPENLALLNVLDPVSAPILMKSEENHALIQLRALRGGMRVVNMIRQNSDSPWKIEISGELKALQNFLGARRALDSMREQASEYAASWKAFTTQIERTKVAAETEKEAGEKKLRNPERSVESHSRRRGTKNIKKRGKQGD